MHLQCDNEKCRYNQVRSCVFSVVYIGETGKCEFMEPKSHSVEASKALRKIKKVEGDLKLLRQEYFKAI